MPDNKEAGLERKGEGIPAEWVERARRGDEAAFERLVRGTERLGWAVSLGVLADPEEARDVLQEAYLDIYRTLHRLRDPDRFLPWFCRIVRWKSISRLRERKRRKDRVPLEAVPESRAPEPQEKEFADPEIWELVGQIPLRYRQPFLMRHLEGLGYEEIAELLGLTVKGVDTRLVRARKMLLEKFRLRDNRTKS